MARAAKTVAEDTVGASVGTSVGASVGTSVGIGARRTDAPRPQAPSPRPPRNSLPFHYGYLVFLGACLLMLPQSLPINTASIFFVPVTEELGITRATFGIHTTIISLSIFAMLTPMSALFRRCPIKPFMCFVIALEACCFLAYSQAKGVETFYIASFFIGAVQAVLVNLVVPVLVNNWFAARTGLFIGIGTCVQGLGAALFSALGSQIIQVWGWRTCYVVFACLVLAIGLPASIFLLRREPSELGLLQIGAENTGAPASDRERPRSAALDGTTALEGMAAHDARRSLAFYLLVAESFCISAGIIFNYYISPYVISLGTDVATAGLASASVMVGMCVGKVAIGAVCDRSVAAGVALGCGAGIAGCLGLAAMTGPAMGVICGFCFCFGLAYASASLLGATLTRHGFGPREFDRIWPTVGMFIALGNASGSFVWGLVTDMFGFTAGLVADAALIGAALVLGLAFTRACAALRSRWTREDG